jgi:hypothetical protein
MPEHDAIILGKRHAIHNFEYANAAARIAATGFIPADVTKWAKQLDDGTYWELTDDSPVTWAFRAGTPKPTTLTDAATIATDASLNRNFRVTLGGNRTLGNPTNALDGQILTWEFIQDGTGSRTIALDTKFALGTDITAVTLTTTASKRDFLTAIYNSVADKFYVRGFIKGF